MDIWQVKYVRIGDLIPNAKNPRKISKEKLERLQDKIQRLGFHNPVKTDENLNVLGGNQRLKALLKIAGKDLEIPVMYPTRPLTQEEKDEIIITDNISDGEWDWEILTSEWNKDLTESWGLNWDFLKLEDCEAEMPNLENGDKKPFQQMTFTLADDQAEIIKDALEKAKKSENYSFVERMGNENSNGNALFMIVSEWLNG